MNVLIVRLSSVGDVAMTVPVIDSLARTYPDVSFLMLSQPHLKPLFAYLPQNVTFYPVYIREKHNGIIGLYKLFREIKKTRSIDYVADLHDVLRTKLLRLLFALSGTKSASINKGRVEKTKLIRKNEKVFHPLKSTFIRYQDVFASLGFSFELQFVSLFGHNKGNLSQIKGIPLKNEREKWIGIAPFAKHQGKIYPLQKTKKILAFFSEQKNVRIFLFGNGEKENDIFSELKNTYPNTVSIIGTLNEMSEELVLMSHLDVMFSMDSANMHLASLVETPVVSVWGATHPYAGFYGWKQSPEDAIQIDLPCRPCSIYGNKPCYRKDYACFAELPAELAIKAIEKHLLSGELRMES